MIYLHYADTGERVWNWRYQTLAEAEASLRRGPWRSERRVTINVVDSLGRILAKLEGRTIYHWLDGRWVRQPGTVR